MSTPKNRNRELLIDTDSKMLDSINENFAIIKSFSYKDLRKETANKFSRIQLEVGNGTDIIKLLWVRHEISKLMDISKQYAVGPIIFNNRDVEGLPILMDSTTGETLKEFISVEDFLSGIVELGLGVPHLEDVTFLNEIYPLSLNLVAYHGKRPGDEPAMQLLGNWEKTLKYFR